MQPKEVCKFILRNKSFYSSLGGFIGVGLLGENCHNINLIADEDLLLNEGVVAFCVGHHLLALLRATSHMSQEP